MRILYGFPFQYIKSKPHLLLLEKIKYIKQIKMRLKLVSISQTILNLEKKIHTHTHMRTQMCVCVCVYILSHVERLYIHKYIYMHTYILLCGKIYILISLHIFHICISAQFFFRWYNQEIE